MDLEGNVCLNILREDWKPVLNLNSVMVGLQYLFLEPNADDPLNKGEYSIYLNENMCSIVPPKKIRGGLGNEQEPRSVPPECQDVYAGWQH